MSMRVPASERTSQRLRELLGDLPDGEALSEVMKLGMRNVHSFRSQVPTAHTFSCLRFAELVTETVARLATGSGGLALGRTGFAPAG